MLASLLLSAIVEYSTSMVAPPLSRRPPPPRPGLEVLLEMKLLTACSEPPFISMPSVLPNATAVRRRCRSQLADRMLGPRPWITRESSIHTDPSLHAIPSDESPTPPSMTTPKLLM